MSLWHAVGRWAGWMWCILCRMLFVVLCSEWAVCVVLRCSGVLCKLLSCAELSVCADSRRRGPFGGKRARLAVHQTCSASPRKLLRSRIDQFSHAACCFARRLMCNCSDPGGTWILWIHRILALRSYCGYRILWILWYHTHNCMCDTCTWAVLRIADTYCGYNLRPHNPQVVSARAPVKRGVCGHAGVRDGRAMRPTHTHGCGGR